MAFFSEIVLKMFMWDTSYYASHFHYLFFIVLKVNNGNNFFEFVK